MRAAKFDANQADLDRALCDIGCILQPPNVVGHGGPGLLIGEGGHRVPVEAQERSVPPNARSLMFWACQSGAEQVLDDQRLGATLICDGDIRDEWQRRG